MSDKLNEGLEYKDMVDMKKINEDVESIKKLAGLTESLTIGHSERRVLKQILEDWLAINEVEVGEYVNDEMISLANNLIQRL